MVRLARNSTTELVELLTQLPPLVGIHHLRVGNHAAEPGDEVVAAFAVGGFEALLAGLMNRPRFDRETNSTISGS